MRHEDGDKSNTPVHEDDWDLHWAGFAESASLNPAQTYRHRLVRDLVVSFRPHRIVDIGAGQGDLLAMLDRACPEAELLCGIELSLVGTTKTKEKVPRADVRQVNLLDDGAPGLLADIRADLATCCEVLEHLDDPVDFLRAAASALVPNAKLLVTVPGGPRSAFDEMIGHRRHYSPTELAELLERAGFRVEESWGAGFPFFNLYRLVVVARGRKLASDIDARDGVSRLARMVMRSFDALFRLNRRTGRRGWQTIAIARRSSERI